MTGFRKRMAQGLVATTLLCVEFTAMLPDPAGVDPELVSRIRALAAHYFRSIGGGRFYPEDRLDADLHWLDVAPFACESFCAGLEESLGLDNEEIRTRMARRQLTTFGDIILAASSLAGQSKAGAQVADPQQTGPVWDRA